MPELRANHPYITGAYHLNKTHWNAVESGSGLSVDLLRELTLLSYDLIFASLPKKLQATIKP